MLNIRSYKIWLQVIGFALVTFTMIVLLQACGEDSTVTTATAIAQSNPTPNAPALPIATATINPATAIPSATPRTISVNSTPAISATVSVVTQPSNGKYTFSVDLPGFPKQIIVDSLPYKDGMALYEVGISDIVGNLVLHLKNGEITHIKSFISPTAKLTKLYPIDTVMFLREGDINLTKGSPYAIAVSSDQKEILIPTDDLRKLAEYLYQQDDLVEAKLKHGLRLLTPIKP